MHTLLRKTNRSLNICPISPNTIKPNSIFNKKTRTTTKIYCINRNQSISSNTPIISTRNRTLRITNLFNNLWSLFINVMSYVMCAFSITKWVFWEELYIVNTFLSITERFGVIIPVYILPKWAWITFYINIIVTFTSYWIWIPLTIIKYSEESHCFRVYTWFNTYIFCNYRNWCICCDAHFPWINFTFRSTIFNIWYRWSYINIMKLFIWSINS